MDRRQFLGFAGGGLGAVAAGPRLLRATGDAPMPAGAAAAAAGGSHPDSSVPRRWFTLALDLARTTPGFSPPVVARALAYAGVALYEAVVPSLRGYRSLGGVLNDLPALPAHGHGDGAPAAANAALARMLRHLFPTAPAEQLRAVDALEARLARRRGGTSSRAARHGVAVADAVFGWSTSDGGHEAFRPSGGPPYRPPAGPGSWVPTPPAFAPAVLPRWGANRPMLLLSPSVGDPGPPLPFSTDPASRFYADAREVLDTVDGLTEDQRAIARFWADDAGRTPTPAGHSFSILTQVLAQQNASLETAAQAYARLGIAVNDALIACWRVKYEHNLVRPVTYIEANIDPHFGDRIPLVTPAFPEYPSGHSVQSAAAARVLTSLFGDLAFTDHTHDARGLAPRHFACFQQAAREAALSRLYAGIHFRTAIDRGLAQGQAIGDVVAHLPLRVG